jgi:hypothetical protein
MTVDALLRKLIPSAWLRRCQIWLTGCHVLHVQTLIDHSSSQETQMVEMKRTVLMGPRNEFTRLKLQIVLRSAAECQLQHGGVRCIPIH